MSIFDRESFIERTARKPSGKTGRRNYAHPTAHYPSFRVILGLLALTPEDQYVEIGCGGGELLQFALETAGSGAGIDHSPDMVEISHENNAQAVASGRTQIVQGDVADLPWEDGRFSAAASANMFFFVEEPEKALAEVCRVLRPGGRFAMVTSADTLPVRLTLGWLYRLKSYSNDKMTEMLQQAGFVDITVSTRKFFSQVCFARKPE